MNTKSTLRKSTLKKQLRIVLNSIALLIILSFRAWSQTETLVDAAEAEKGVLSSGLTISAAVTGFSGTGYVTNFNSNDDVVTVTLTAPVKGLYKLKVRYNGTSGEKTQSLIINSGSPSDVVFPKTTTYSEIEVGAYVLNMGANTVAIQSKWGYMDVDKFSIYTTEKNIYNIDASLVDPNANQATKDLYAYMVSQFGKKIISGHTADYYDQIKVITGNAPMLKAYDFQSYTQGYAYAWKNGGHAFGWVDNGNTTNAIEWYNSTDKKGIVSFQWHWHSPSGGTPGQNTFYTESTSFDITKAVTEGTAEYSLIIQDIDSIASQLKKLEKAGVPVVWRPLHEAGGGWFWWGAKGAVPCKKLYDIIYDRLMNHHNIHNLIWTWSTPETEWYPGNSKMDIVGYDSYPGTFNYNIQKNSFDVLYRLTEGKKLIAMTENGPIPDPNDCINLDAPWSYFMTWSDLLIQQNSDAHIKEVYRNLKVLSFGTNYDSSTVEDPDPVDPPTAIDPEVEAKLKVYPNPVKDFLSIGGIQPTRLSLVDLEGRLVFLSEAPIEKIDVRAMRPGFYILNLHYKQDIIRKKVIIEK
jgi:mannan endo-1,4-beta-mannosidase